MKIYISSKASGIKDYNRPAFHKRQKLLESLGHDVHNPMATEHEPKDATCWCDFLSNDMYDVAGCDVIDMWGRWLTSQGAWIELLTAHRHRVGIHIEQWWLRWIPLMMNLMFTARDNGEIVE